MWQSLTAILLLLSVLTNGEVNILLKKPVFTSEDPGDAGYLNDGKTNGSPLLFDAQSVKWAVFDLGDAYTLSKIIMWNGDGQRVQGVSLYIGNVFHPCKFHRQIKLYDLCKSGVMQKGEKTEIVCQKSVNAGRYLAIVKGDFQSSSDLEDISILEVQAFGKLVPGQKYPTRPIMSNEKFPRIPADAFKITKEIISGVGSVTIPVFSSGFLYLNRNCQPIIWDSSSLNVFGVACMTPDGKGRLTAFAKESYLSSVVSLTTPNVLKTNLLKWLSPNIQNPALVLTKTISTISDLKKNVKPGDIIDFYTSNAYSKDLLNEIINLCLNGTNGLSLDHTFWTATNAGAKASFMRILNLFNLDYSLTMMSLSSAKTFSITEADLNDNALGLEDILENMAINHDYFLEKGPAVTKKLSEMSATLSINSGIGSTLKAIIKKYDVLIDWMCPCTAAPAVDSVDRKIIDVYVQLVQSQSLLNSNYKLPCIDLFPGDYDQPQSKKTTTLSVFGDVAGTLNPIGLYLEAGSTLQYDVKSSSGEWSMSVGCHTDRLDDQRSKWYRYPDVYVGKIDIAGTGQIFSPFGGVLWLGNTNANQSITITISNVIAAPFFNGRDSSAAQQWNDKRNNPGLWAQIFGESIGFCEKSVNVKNYDGDYLVDLMKNYWDSIVKMDYAITGVNWKIQRPQIAVLDIMVSFGFGHSGYPIEVWDDWHQGIFNKTVIDKEGSWGMCHEIGHNLQDNRWTFTGLTEVTNNLLCLFNYDKLFHVSRFGLNENVLRDNKDAIVKYLVNGAKFDDFQNNPWIALAIYSQLSNHLGWGFYKDVFKYYIDNNLKPSSDVDKIATWIQISCKIGEQNLLPIFDFWGIPITGEVIKAVGNLPCFFPKDFMTEFSSPRSNYINGKYSNCNKVSKYFKDYDPTPGMTGQLDNFIKEL